MSDDALAKALLLARTVRHLRPAQVAHRVRLRGQRWVTQRAPGPVEHRLRRPVPDQPGWPDGFTPLDAVLAHGFPSAAANARGEFRFLESTRSLGTPHDWQQADAEQLWRYHLHYFEWGWSFLHHDDREEAREAFAALWRSWQDRVPFGRGDAWSPYVVSLRAWAMCGLYQPLVAGSAVERDYLRSLALHAGYVRAHLELDVGGNHLLKNLKALLGVGVFLGDAGLIEHASMRIGREVGVQVLPDGGHYERSPSYHCQVLGDFIDVAELLAAAGAPPIAGLTSAIAAMRRWLGAMLHPDGDVPLFNDCVLVGTDRIALLAPSPRPPERLTVLQPSGYVVARPGDDLHVVMDVGPPCPPELPAHAQADCLSFEASVRGERVIVDSGASTYQGKVRRAFERSTAAHNTVEVDGADQTEVWGAFRAARRANAVLEKAGDDDGTITVVASHDGYTRLPGSPRHRRTWHVTATGLTVVDDVEGSGVHALTSRLHASPDSAVARLDGEVVIGPVRLTCPEGSPEVREAEVATGFGVLRQTSCVAVGLTRELPARLTFDVRLQPGAEGAPPGRADGRPSKREEVL